MTDLADLTIAQASAGLRAQEFSAVDLLDAVERRAAITEAHLHAYLTLDRDGSRAAAEAADVALADGDQRPLLGIPIALKDNMVTKGVETTASSQILAGWKPPYDGTAVRRLKEAGAVVPHTFDDFGSKIKQTYDKLVVEGKLVSRPDVEPPRIPIDYEVALRDGIIRRSAHFISTISDDRGEELDLLAHSLAEGLDLLVRAYDNLERSSLRSGEGLAV